MNLFRRILQRIRDYRRDPGVSDCPDAPDDSIVRDQFDVLFAEEQMEKAPKKESSN